MGSLCESTVRTQQVDIISLRVGRSQWWTLLPTSLVLPNYIHCPQGVEIRRLFSFRRRPPFGANDYKCVCYEPKLCFEETFLNFTHQEFFHSLSYFPPFKHNFMKPTPQEKLTSRSLNPSRDFNPTHVHTENTNARLILPKYVNYNKPYAGQARSN